MDKDKKRKVSKSIYRIVIITIAFALITSAFAGIAVSQGLNRTAIIAVGAALAALWLGTIITTELAYKKRESGE